MNQASQTINWQKAYARLEQMRRTSEAGGKPSPAEVKRILRARAQALAQLLQEALPPPVSGGWLVVSTAETAAELFRPLASANFPGAIFYRCRCRDSENATDELHLDPCTGAADECRVGC